MHPTFRDPRLQEEFSTAGYSVLDVLEPEPFQALMVMAERLLPSGGDGFTSSVESGSAKMRREFHDLLVDSLGQVFEEWFDDHQIVQSGALIKWPTGASVIHPHQDWTFVDEEHFRSASLWFPLVDVDKGNGAMGVLPGSHQVARRLRPSRLPSWYQDPVAELSPSEMTLLPLRTGQGVVTDHALLHCSPPNRSSGPRVALAVAVAPRAAPLLHYLCRPDDIVEQYAIPDPSLFQRLQPGSAPEGAPLLGEVPFGAETFTVEDLVKAAGRVRAGSADPAATPVLAESSTVEAPDPPVGSPAQRLSRRMLHPVRRLATHLSSRRPQPRRPVLRRPDQEQQLSRDGFLVVDLLGPEAVQRLRAGYGSLDHRHDRDSPFAEGFHTSLYDHRPSYRRQVFDLIDGEFGAALRSVLVDYRLFLANFAVKLEHSAAVPQHLDWTFLDEARFRSVTVWCPIEDVSADNGALGVVPRSHCAVDFVRPVNHRDYDRHAEVASTQDSEVLDVAAGQAVIMDNRTVHFSPPNDTDGLRVAAAGVAAPAEADLYHYWVDDHQQPVRYRVSGDFYLNYLPGQLPAEADGVLGHEVVTDVRIA